MSENWSIIGKWFSENAFRKILLGISENTFRKMLLRVLNNFISFKLNNFISFQLNNFVLLILNLKKLYG
jgi:hypothetical protein